MSDDGWAPALAHDELAEGRAIAVDVGDSKVLLYRAGERIFAIGNRCTHQGAPLHRGPVKGLGARPTITCPAHGSVFALEDGAVMRGPARAPVPGFEVRVEAGMIELRAKG